MMRSKNERIRQFLRKPLREKFGSLFFRVARLFPGIAVPVRLPFGGWWLARNDFVGSALFCGGFETAECAFMQRFLRPGMTVLDIGAHHGFFTVLASRKVGAKGKVLAIEPSPRERERLAVHLRINRCTNVVVEGCALGEGEGVGMLHLVHGGQTGCNSLRKPEVSEATSTVRAVVRRLDDVLREKHITRADFVKMDVEGAELSVLRGASQLLQDEPRPAILAEVQDIRTKPWGYAAREIVRHLAGDGYRWFRPLTDGTIEELDTEREQYDGNFVAVPEERIASIASLTVSRERNASSSDGFKRVLAS